MVVSELDLNKRDGSTTHMENLIKEMRGLGHDVTPVFPNFPGEREVIIPGSLFVPLSITLSGKAGTALRLLEFQWKIPRYVSKIIRSGRFDAAYVREGVFTNRSISSIAKRLPVVVEVNGMISFEMVEAGIPASLVRLRDLFEGHAMRKARRFVAVSPGIARGISDQFDIPADRLNVVRNGVDPDLFSPKSKSECRKKWHIGENAKVAAWTGYMAGWQGLETLIKAWVPISEKEDRVLLLAGTGPLEGLLRSFVKKKGLEGSVRMLGRVPYEDIPQILGASDVTVAPFTRRRNEKYGFSALKIYEYMASERPVVASDIPDLRKLLKGAGILVPPDSPKELRTVLVQLLDDPHLQEKMGKRGRSKIMAGHTWKITAEKVSSIIREVLE